MDVYTYMNQTGMKNQTSINSLDINIEVDWADEQDRDKELVLAKWCFKNNKDWSECGSQKVWEKLADKMNVRNNVLFVKNN